MFKKCSSVLQYFVKFKQENAHLFIYFVTVSESFSILAISRMHQIACDKQTEHSWRPCYSRDQMLFLFGR
jgi:hypothetical protein